MTLGYVAVVGLCTAFTLLLLSRLPPDPRGDLGNLQQISSASQKEPKSGGNQPVAGTAKPSGVFDAVTSVQNAAGIGVRASDLRVVLPKS